MAIPSTPLSEFFPLVFPHAMGVAEPVAEFNLRLSAIEFCERTRCWRHLVTLPVTRANRTIAAPTNTAIHEFEEATWNGQLLEPTQYTEASPAELNPNQNTGQPRYITQIEPGMVSIYPFQEGTVRISMFLKPKHGQAYGGDGEDPMRDAYNVVPEFMLTQHGEAIAAGALARILIIKDQPFTDPQLAAVWRGVFEQAAGSHFSRNMRGQQRAPIRTKPQWM